VAQVVLNLVLAVLVVLALYRDQVARTLLACQLKKRLPFRTSKHLVSIELGQFRPTLHATKMKNLPPTSYLSRQLMMTMTH